jgi:hypothetical protein
MNIIIVLVYAFSQPRRSYVFIYHVHVWCWNLNNFQQLFDLVHDLGLYEEYVHWFYTNQLSSQRAERYLVRLPIFDKDVTNLHYNLLSCQR